MNARLKTGMLLFLAVCVLSGCPPAAPGVPPAGGFAANRAKPRPSADVIKTHWERFEQADDEREQRRAITAIGRVGAAAQDEIPKLQKIADGENYQEKVRQAAKSAIERIENSVNEDPDE